jgi:hypothetical protein
VKHLFGILAQLPEITAASVEDFLSIGVRQAQRYVKAIELAMPYLMKSRPIGLASEMDHGLILPMRRNDWTDALPAPAPATLVKLHYDLRDLGNRCAD